MSYFEAILSETSLVNPYPSCLFAILKFDLFCKGKYKKR